MFSFSPDGHLVRLCYWLVVHKGKAGVWRSLSGYLDAFGSFSRFFLCLPLLLLRESEC